MTIFDCTKRKNKFKTMFFLTVAVVAFLSNVFVDLHWLARAALSARRDDNCFFLGILATFDNVQRQIVE